MSIKQSTVLSLLMLCGVSAYAQSDYKPVTNAMEYKMLYDAKEGVQPITGDFVQAHMYLYVDGQKIYSSREVGERKPLGIVLQEAQSSTDIQEVIKLMSAGDSVSVLMNVDSMLQTGAQRYAWMKPGTGQKAEYIVKLLNIKQMSKREE